MKDYERREPKLYDFYKELGISYLASDRRVMIELDKREKDAISRRDVKEQGFVQLAREYIGKDSQTRKLYDNYLKRHGVKFPLTKREKKIKLIKNVKKSLSTLKLDFNPTILNVITDKNYNVKNPPLLVINDNVISEGKVLTEREISKYIKEYAI